MKKKGIALAFNWIFAVIAGGFILFLAIFAAGKFIERSEEVSSTEAAATIDSLTDPLETGLASGRAYEIMFQKESKVFFDCNEKDNRHKPFGSQTISFSEKTFGEKYGQEGEKITIVNKHLFVEELVEGKKMYFFAKPLFMPFKITDMTIIISDSDKYCFHDTPEEIEEGLDLNLKNIVFVNETGKCEGIDVCFGGKNCDISVDEEKGSVKKNRKTVSYSGDWVYGAIFSSPKIYECNVKRVKARFDELAKIYLDKIPIIERQGCEPQVEPILRSIVGDIENSFELKRLYEQIDELDTRNRLAKEGCKLYYTKGWDI